MLLVLYYQNPYSDFIALDYLWQVFYNIFMSKKLGLFFAIMISFPVFAQTVDSDFSERKTVIEDSASSEDVSENIESKKKIKKKSKLPFGIFAFPYAYLNIDELNGGLMLGLTDLFSNKASVTIDGNFSQSEKKISLSLKFPAVNAKRPGFELFCLYGSDRKKFFLEESNNASYLDFTKEGLDVYGAIFGKFAYGHLDLKLSLGYKNFSIVNSEVYLAGYGKKPLDALEYPLFAQLVKLDEDDIRGNKNLIYGSLGFKLSFAKKGKYFTNEKSLLLKTSVGRQFDEKLMVTAEGQGTLDIPVPYDRLRFFVTGSGYHQPDNKLYYARTGASVGLTILNPNYLFKRVIGVEGAVEFAAFTLPIGTVSVFTSVQFAAYENMNQIKNHNTGFSAGAKFYTPGDPVPGGFLAVSYNLNSQSFYFYAGVGLVL